VVFHSSVEDMLPHQGELPFAAIADPSRELYTLFGVGSSLKSVLHPRGLGAGLRAAPNAVRGRRVGRNPSPGKGESPLGLPADFLVGPDGRVLAAKYGQHANDQWEVDELLQLAKSINR
jgi:peroxiredoxin